MIVIISRISRLGAHVHHVARRRVVDVAPNLGAVRALVDGGEVIALVVIGEDVPLGDALDFIGLIGRSQQVPIVLARYQPALARDAAMLAGASDVVRADADEAEVRQIVERCSSGPSYRDVAPVDPELAALLDEPEASDELDAPDADISPPQLRLVGADELTAEPMDDELARLLLAEDEAAERAPEPQEPVEAGPVKLVGLDSMLTAPEQAAPVEPLPIAEHRVIVVLSPKGGVGKTTVATNLATALAHRYRHQSVLVDLDDQFGDVASALKLTPQHTLEAAFTPDGVQQPLVVKGLFNLYRDELFVLCASDSPAAMERVVPEQITTLLSQLRDDYGYVVVDTGAGLSELTLAALEVATDIVVVASLDVSAIRSTRRALDLLRRLELMPPRMHVIVNLADTGAGLTEQDVAIALDSEVEASVPRSTEVSLSMNIGEPLVVHRKSTPMARSIGQLVGKIVGDASSDTGRRVFWKLGR